jgi:hypothetical protein
MASTRRDLSGVFDTELRGQCVRKAAVLEKSFHLSHKGITFASDTALAEWTEVGVEMRLPQLTALGRARSIVCRAVVVQCSRRVPGPGYDVALLFLNLPKNAQNKIDILPETLSPLSISITW